MSMTRNHFVLIAATIKAQRDDARKSEALETDGSLWAVEVALDSLSRDMASTLGRFNPSFDRDRFLKACGVED
jgi:pyrroloquinoline quinone (PQQ) biosynthesis protein C